MTHTGSRALSDNTMSMCHLIGYERGQHVVVHQVHSGHRHLVRPEPRPAMAGVAVASDVGAQVVGDASDHGDPASVSS